MGHITNTWVIRYQWTDFRRKQNNPYKRTLISMFCWFDFFFLFIGPNTKLCLQEAQVYGNQRKIESFISISIEHILFTQPDLKQNYDR